MTCNNVYLYLYVICDLQDIVLKRTVGTFLISLSIALIFVNIALYQFEFNTSVQSSLCFVIRCICTYVCQLYLKNKIIKTPK